MNDLLWHRDMMHGLVFMVICITSMLDCYSKHFCLYMLLVSQ